MKSLTDKQVELYRFMSDFFHENDQLPPIHVMATYFGCRENNIDQIQKRIEKKGYIERNAVGKYRFAR